MADKENIPRHIAIIMDGNGRWAKEKGLSRTSGHKEGINRIKEIIRAADEFGVKFLTLFAFSAENWSRPRNEISILMRYLDDFLVREVAAMHKKNIRFRVIGRDEPLPKRTQRRIQEAQKKTALNTGLTLVLALNYGARQEIVDAVKQISGLVAQGKVSVSQIDEDIIKSALYTFDIPDPDLLIRTSGEVRISNFLLWQLSYAELYFPKKYWPDFKKDDLLYAIKEYNMRQRRFGNIE